MKEKIAFDTENEAKEELERILTTQHKPWLKSQIKPCRYYLLNGKYYLTSKPLLTTYGRD